MGACGSERRAARSEYERAARGAAWRAASWSVRAAERADIVASGDEADDVEQKPGEEKKLAGAFRDFGASRRPRENSSRGSRRLRLARTGLDSRTASTSCKHL